MQLDVGSEPYLSIVQALGLLTSPIFYFKSFLPGWDYLEIQLLVHIFSSSFFPGTLHGWIDGPTEGDVHKHRWAKFAKK